MLSAYKLSFYIVSDRKYNHEIFFTGEYYAKEAYRTFAR
jgi:hypothetical protein